MKSQRVTGQKTSKVSAARSRQGKKGRDHALTSLDFWKSSVACSGRSFYLSRQTTNSNSCRCGSNPRSKALAEKTADGFPAPLAVIERPVVDIHADEFVGEVAAHVAGVLQRVLHGFGAMIQAELDARGERVGNLLARCRIKSFVNHVAAERQRQTVVFSSPPDAEIFAQNQSFIFDKSAGLRE